MEYQLCLKLILLIGINEGSHKETVIKILLSYQCGWNDQNDSKDKDFPPISILTSLSLRMLQSCLLFKNSISNDIFHLNGQFKMS